MSFQTVEQYEAQIATLTAENERLRALVISAYCEGWEDGKGYRDQDSGWEQSATRAALQPKEGEE